MTPEVCDWDGCTDDAVMGMKEPFGHYKFCEDHLAEALNDYTQAATN